jgi:hypothetical protein
MSSSTRACSVFFRAPSTNQWPSIGTGGNSPGSAALAATACEMGTWSQPGWPNGAVAPVSRSVATSTSLWRRRRKSLLRPGADSMRRIWASSGACVNSPVGKARPSRSSAASTERRSKAYCSAACATRPGSMAARRANSASAGRMNSEGRTMSSRGPGVLDEGRAQLARRDAVGQAGGDESAGRHAHVTGQVVQVQAGHRVVQRAQRPDLVDRAQRAAAGQRQADARRRRGGGQGGGRWASPGTGGKKGAVAP